MHIYVFLRVAELRGECVNSRVWSVSSCV